MKMNLAFMSIVLFSSMSAFAGDAGNINWSCSRTIGNEVTLVNVKNGKATVKKYNNQSELAPELVGGPYQPLETFDGGEARPGIEIIGVKTSNDDSFCFIAGALTYKTNSSGQFIHLTGMKCM